MDLGLYSQHVPFSQLLSLWSKSIQEGDDEPQDPLRQLLDTIKSEILSKYEKDSKHMPRKDKWTVQDLFSALEAWESSSSSDEKDSYADWANLVNCGLYLVKDLEKKVQGVNFRGKKGNVLLQHNDPNNFTLGHNRPTVRQPSTLFMTQKTADRIHDSHLMPRMESDDLRWTETTKKYATRPPQTNLGWDEVLMQFEHRKAKQKTEESEYFAKLQKLEFKELGSSAAVVIVYDEEVGLKVKGNDVQEEEQEEIAAVKEVDDMGPGPIERLRRLKAKGAVRSSPRGSNASTRVTEDLVDARHAASLPFIPEKDFTDDPYNQSGEYSAQRSSHISVIHVLSAVVIGRNLRLIHADRQGVIITDPIHVVRDFPLFLAMLFIFQRFLPEEWGRLPALSGTEFTPNFGDTPTTYTIGDTLYKSWGIVGRHTIVKSVKSPDGATYAAKFSWQYRPGKEREHLWLKRAWDALQPSDQVHIPQCIAWEEYGITTATIRERLGLPLDTGKSRRYYMVLLSPRISGNLRHEKMVGKIWLKAFWDCFKVYFKLWKSGICQGDITDTNMGVRVLEDSEHSGNTEQGWVGVLIDFDCATDTTNPEDERTGSRLFKSRAAHLDEQREWYDEVESFLWVGVFRTCVYGDPPKKEMTEAQAKKKEKLISWGRMQEDALLGAKTYWLEREGWKGHAAQRKQGANWKWVQELAKIVAAPGAKALGEQGLYDKIIKEVCTPSLEEAAEFM
ncbi:hypothetical protein BDN72DRAFT_846282 [Pluteus cervinus]|uniref:Uncharacterized protein n=1 Tax=Pluteus cervinus TaxID=181527 RepID=A0ACD3AFU3_9AGAR|nr:hypothetical protein BDN72DRAFT_846282 [Pluteus cervinus]